MGIWRSFLHLLGFAPGSQRVARPITRPSKSPFTRRFLLERLEVRETPAGDFRIVSYNIHNSGGQSGVPPLSSDLGTILQAIGNESTTGVQRPIDVLAIQEVSSQATTSQNVVNQFNAIYGSGAYARGTLNGATTAQYGLDTVGLVYNTQTVQLLSETAIGSVSTSGQPRQTIRYKMRPLGIGPGNDFYIYNSHYKSGTSSTNGVTDVSRRAVEAAAIRADADALGEGAHIIYAGDFNTQSSSEAGFQTIVSAGNGQAFDPVNRLGSWHLNSTYVDLFTQAPSNSPPSGYTGGGLDDRFDFQMLSGEWFNGTGMEYIAGSYHTFGNNGSVPVNGDIDDAGNTALPGLANRTTVLNLLATVSDHLPVVADYRFGVDAVAVSYTGGNWGENFDSLPSSGTFSLSGAGPIALAGAPISAAGLEGWSMAKFGGSSANAAFAVDAGGGTSAAVVSYGSSASSERALGSIATGSSAGGFGVVFVNNTGTTLDSFTLSYTGEQWRRGSGSANTLAFSYAVHVDNIVIGQYTAVPSLDFTAPNTGSTGALNGNLAGNKQPVSAAVNGLNWMPGEMLTLRWLDTDDGGSDDGLAIDDLTFSAVSNQNHAPTMANQTFSVPENSPGSTSVGTVIASDTDAGQSLSYAITAGNTNGVFTINASNGAITVSPGASLDYETLPNYSLTVTATDNGSPTMSGSATVAVNLTNVDDVTTFGLGDIAFTGYQATTTDKMSIVLLRDVGPGSVLTITDIGWSGSSLSTSEGNSVITFGGFFAAGTQVNYDAGRTAGSRWAVGSTTANLSDSTGGSFALNATGDNLFAYNGTTAPTDGNSVLWVAAFSSAAFLTTGSVANSSSYLPSIFGAPASLGNAAFTLNLASGSSNQNGAQTSPAAVVGTAPQVRSAIYTPGNWTTFTSAGAQAVPPNITYTITTNSPPTDLALTSTSIAENQAGGSTVGTFSAADPNAGDTFTYSLVSGAGGDDNGSFTIDAGGNLRTASVFDFEIKNTYTIRVRATDQGGLSFENVFAITVVNQNEAPTDISLSPTSIAENQPSGTTVGVLSSADPDDEPAFDYSLAAGGIDNASFTIDSSGNLKTAAAFDYETKNSYAIRIRTTDQGGLFFEKDFTITVTDVAEGTSTSVASVTATAAGVIVAFNTPINTSLINLYDQGGVLGPADVTLVGASTGAVRGSMVFNASGDQFTFVKTGPTSVGASAGTLAPDTYTLTLRSAANGFTDAGGVLLRDIGGVNAGNYVTTFVVAAPPANAITVGLPDFTRGFSQTVNVPNTASGLPIVLSNGNNVAGVDLVIHYDPSLLTIAGISTPIAGASASINVNTPGIAIVQVSSATAFAAGNGQITLATLTASVPSTAPYASKHVIRLTNLVVRDANLATLPAIADDALHVAAFFDDLNADQAYTSVDTILMQRLGVGINTGVSAFQMADPVVLGDANNDFTFTSVDTITVQRLGVGISVATVPQLPPGAGSGTPGGPDPVLSLGRVSGTPGAKALIPVNLLVTETGVDVAGIDIVIAFDPTRLTVDAVSLGSLLAGSGFSVVFHADAANGLLRIQAASSRVQSTLPLGASGTLLNIEFWIKSSATPGPIAINLLHSVNGAATRLVNSNLAPLTLSPSPTNSESDALDGVVTVLVTTPARFTTTVAAFPPRIFLKSPSPVLSAYQELVVTWPTSTSSRTVVPPASGNLKPISGGLALHSMLVSKAFGGRPGSPLDFTLLCCFADANFNRRFVS